MPEQAPEAQWLRLREETNALDYLERASSFIKESTENVRAWKWVIIALHGALYGFAVAAAHGTDDTRLNRKKRERSRLADDGSASANEKRPDEKEMLCGFWEVLKLCQKPKHMKMLCHSRHLQLTPSQRESIKLMKSEFRNEFEHFQPKLWSIEIHCMPQMTIDILEVIRFLALETNTYVYLTTEEAEKVDKLVKENIAFLEATPLYKECKLAEDLCNKSRNEMRGNDIPFKKREFLSRAAQGHSRTVDLFLDAGMDPDVRGTKDMTALMFATKNGHIDTVKALLASGAEVDARSEDGSTALKIAESRGDKEIEETLRLARFSFLRRNLS